MKLVFKLVLIYFMFLIIAAVVGIGLIQMFVNQLYI